MIRTALIATLVVALLVALLFGVLSSLEPPRQNTCRLMKFNTSLARAPPTDQYHTNLAHGIHDTHRSASTATLPPFFDCRDKWRGCIYRVYDQGECGSCWAFASLATLSSRFCIMTCTEPADCSQGALDARRYNDMMEARLDVDAQRAMTLLNVYNKIRSNSFARRGGRELTRAEWDEYFSPAANYITQPRESDRSLKSMASAYTRLFELQFNVADATQLPLPGAGPGQAQKFLDTMFDYYDKDGDGTIKVDEWLRPHLIGPVALSVEALLACALDSSGSLEEIVSKECGGGSLEATWAFLCNWGVPTAFCAGYSPQHFEDRTRFKYGTDGATTCRAPDGKSPLLSPTWNKRGGAPPHIFRSSCLSMHLPFISPQSSCVGISPTSRFFGVHDDRASVNPKYFRARNAYAVRGGEASIRMEIMNRGPVSSGFNVYPDFQDHFSKIGRGGQYYWAATDPWPPQHPVVASNAKSQATALIYEPLPRQFSRGGHSVMIIGWGSFSGIDYWIIQNSWGTEWGTDGYPGVHGVSVAGGGMFWMRRGVDAAGIESNVYAGMPDVREQGFSLAAESPDDGVLREIVPCGPDCRPNIYDGPCTDGHCTQSGSECSQDRDCVDVDNGMCTAEGRCSINGGKLCNADHDCGPGDPACCLNIALLTEKVGCVRPPPHGVADNTFLALTCTHPAHPTTCLETCPDRCAHQWVTSRKYM